jgi:hypothetical protein
MEFALGKHIELLLERSKVMAKEQAAYAPVVRPRSMA